MCHLEVGPTAAEVLRFGVGPTSKSDRVAEQAVRDLETPITITRATIQSFLLLVGEADNFWGTAG